MAIRVLLLLHEDQSWSNTSSDCVLFKVNQYYEHWRIIVQMILLEEKKFLIGAFKRYVWISKWVQLVSAYGSKEFTPQNALDNVLDIFTHIRSYCLFLFLSSFLSFLLSCFLSFSLSFCLSLSPVFLSLSCSPTFSACFLSFSPSHPFIFLICISSLSFWMREEENHG